MRNINKAFIDKSKSIEEAMAVIQKSGVGIALVVDDKQNLLGTITDGDVRRALLKKIPLSSGINEILMSRPPNYPQPTVALKGTSHRTLLDIMEQKSLRHVPLLDEEGRVVDIALLSELVGEEHVFPLNAVVMAGGKGERLHPLTKDVPKPMLPLNDQPMLEHIINQLRKADIKDIYITTNYRAEVIEKHFGKGEAFGVRINCVNESQPLGTAGALSLIGPVPNKSTLVINGDILTQLDFRSMYDFHHQHKADMTVGVRIYEIEIPYGVVDIEDIYIKKIIEKPLQRNVVNAGVYILEPCVYEYIPREKRIDMPDLVEHLLKAGKTVISFPIQEYWLDVGQPGDYERAKIDLKNGILK